MEKSFRTKIDGYDFIYDGHEMVIVSKSWDDENPDELSKFKIGKVKSQKEFEIEVGWWYMKNRNLF
jgi:hypothetical protein